MKKFHYTLFIAYALFMVTYCHNLLYWINFNKIPYYGSSNHSSTNDVIMVISIIVDRVRDI